MRVHAPAASARGSEQIGSFQFHARDSPLLDYAAELPSCRREREVKADVMPVQILTLGRA